MTLDRNTLLEAAKVCAKLKKCGIETGYGKRPAFADDCAAELRALAAAQPDTVCVPREPTWEIRKAIWEAMFDEDGWHGGTEELAITDDIYRAILSAAGGKS